jgi:hypothetical protein
MAEWTTRQRAGEPVSKPAVSRKSEIKILKIGLLCVWRDLAEVLGKKLGRKIDAHDVETFEEDGHPLDPEIRRLISEFDRLTDRLRELGAS